MYRTDRRTSKAYIHQLEQLNKQSNLFLLQQTTYAQLEEAIEVEVKAAGLLPHPPWILKLIQLFEVCL